MSLTPVNGIEQEYECEILFQQDGAWPYFNHTVRNIRMSYFPFSGLEEANQHPDPHRSPDFLPLIFFLIY